MIFAQSLTILQKKMAIDWPIQIGSITCIVIYQMNYQLTKFESTIMNT